MSRLILTIVGLLAAMAILIIFVPSVFTRTQVYDQYVCTACGLKKTADLRKCGGIVYRNRVFYENTAISRAIQATNCPHGWMRFQFGHNKRSLFGGGAFADGGIPSSTLPHLLLDDSFAKELAQMEKPAEVWTALVSALNSSREFESAFIEWQGEPNPVGFAVWASTNGLLGDAKSK